MKDSQDILTKDLLKLIKQYKYVPHETLAVNLMYHIRTNVNKYFIIHHKEA